MLKKLLKQIIPAVLKFIWKKLDGKKSVAGIVTTAVGLGMTQIEPLKPFAVETTMAGIGILTGGLTHKAVKKQKEKQDGR